MALRARFPLVLLGLLALAWLPVGAAAGDGADAERAAHGDEAATPQRSFDERIADVHLRQYQLGCLSQLTYLIGSAGEAAVVDPQRDVGHYVADAKALGWTITKVFLTHTNADFVAGHTELARRQGATVYVSAASGSKFPHEPLEDGTRVALGKATIEFWATPGHTLDSMTILVHAPGAAADPAWAITGDTLFIGGIGRPDLVGGDVTPVVLADKAYDSMQRLRTLPDGTKVLPAHGAGSLCGAHLSPETVSTIGQEKLSNPYLQPMSRAQFVSRVVTGLPVAPAYFKENVRINRAGPPVIEGLPEMPPALSPAEAQAKAQAGAWFVDLRDARAYAAGHVPGSVNVAVRGRLDTWTGIVVPFDRPLILVGSDDEVQEAAFRFRRIGLDQVAGRLAGGVQAWRDAGLEVRTTRLVQPRELAALIEQGREPVVVDVRTHDEYAELRLGDYANLPLSDWQAFGRVLDPKAPVLLLCNSAYRSSMAVGLAERQGFTDLMNLDGGLDAWLTAGLPSEGTATRTATASTPAVFLPEPIEPTTLAAVLMDQPGAYAVLDVRPAWQFAEYHVPGAANVTPEAAVAHVRGLATAVRVVVVDRDGTLGYAVAGLILAAQPARSVRVLSGGTGRFWREVEVPGAAPAAPAASAPPAVAPPAPIPAPAAPAPRRRSAGC